MPQLTRTAILLLRLALAFAAMLIAYLVGTMLVGDTGVVMTPEEQALAGRGLVIAALVSSLVLSFLVLRSPWRGPKLIAAVFAVQFGIETFMSQIETIYFNAAVQMETSVLVGVVASGALRAAIFALLATLIFGKLRRADDDPDALRTPALPADWGRRVLGLSVLYVLVYFLFGYFVAWRSAELRLFYTGSEATKPFVTHLVDLFLREDPWILPFQLLRGALWTALATLIVRMIVARRWEASLAVALSFSLLIAMPLVLFPNPYMPPAVQRAHFVELMTSMLLFGAAAGWTMYGPNRARTA